MRKRIVSLGLAIAVLFAIPNVNGSVQATGNGKKLASDLYDYGTYSSSEGYYYINYEYSNFLAIIVYSPSNNNVQFIMSTKTSDGRTSQIVGMTYELSSGWFDDGLLSKASFSSGYVELSAVATLPRDYQKNDKLNFRYFDGHNSSLVDSSSWYTLFSNAADAAMIMWDELLDRELYYGLEIVLPNYYGNGGSSSPVTPTPTPKPKPTSAPKPTATPVPTVKPVKKKVVSDTSPSGTTLTIGVPETVVCGDAALADYGVDRDGVNIKWKSNDKEVATVDSTGTIRGKSAGVAIISCSTSDGAKAEVEIQVLYKDVTNSKDFWYTPTNYLTVGGVVKGYDKQTKFKPGNDCTRAQMVTFLWRLSGCPSPKSTKLQFNDVKKTDYFYKPVLWAVENGITTGVSKTKFSPSGVCTRAQTVTFLWRMADKPTPRSSNNKFSDVKRSDYFYNAVLWAAEKKIVAGYDDGTFKPQGKCLRRQMVTFLYKYDKYINGNG